MVACAVATAAVHPSSSVVRLGGERAPLALASPEVSSAAPKMTATPSGGGTSVAVIEQLKLQLTVGIDNKDHEKVTLAVEGLERANMTKEALEVTRVGKAVNEARKALSDALPSIAKRCRDLIKSWLRLCEQQSGGVSGPTSRNGTPKLVSPAVGRRVTPHTPANKRITPGLASEQASTQSPSNGSYAPRASNHSPSSFHKSQSVGGDLAGHDNGVRNGKRKPDEPAAASSSIKRTKTSAAGLSAVNGTPSTPTLMEARRAAVQSTSDLVAQLTSSSQHLGNCEGTIREHEERVRREQGDMQIAQALAHNGTPQSPYVFEKKRKYEKKSKAAAAEAPSTSSPSAPITSPSTDEKKKCGIVLRLTRTGTDGCLQASTSATSDRDRDKEERKERRKKEKKEAAMTLHASKSAPVLAPSGEIPSSSTDSTGPSTSTASNDVIPSNGHTTGELSAPKMDWMASLPSLEVLRQRAKEEKKKNKKAKRGGRDPEKAYTLKVRDRVVLALPFLEINDIPDFIKFKYPDPARYYAEENFRHGMERPWLVPEASKPSKD